MMKTENKKNQVEEPVSLYSDKYTYADYLKFEFEEMVELIRGKLFKMSPAPSSNHQKISGNLHGELYQKFKKSACELFSAPFDVILPIENKKRNQSNTVVQPDLCIICDSSKIEKAGCFGAPDLVIEIISPNTLKKDLEYKYSIYEESGVREYWTVLPGEEAVIIHVLVDKKYEQFKAFGKEDELYSSIFPEMKIKLDDVFPKQED
ncbi:Uma2 family endonuclease [Portibacter lacus]|uniref:Putative restriction endonuclease domain-containing protein n=1 Tax=Portibacter lacus TaxID=1099794 RepID=A0AA37SPP9_9BACT|nr:Uma2 family endonuclease [Portibacter lacus]GLR17867.1 hypothetical protein GCM10007940_24820 [Portibacter lacus]